MLTANISGVTYLNVSGKEISDLTGIEAFTAITYLNCDDNQLISLDVSNNTALSSLICRSNQLTSLDVSANTALTILYVNGNQLTSLDVRANTALTRLRCHDNQLTSLDLSTNTTLTYLDCDNNLLLQPMDRVRIYGLTEMVAPRFVFITGYVQNSGQYPLRENMNLYDLVFSGGGLADDEWLEQVYMERADLIRMDKDNITSRVIPFNLGELINNPLNQNINWALDANDLVRIYSKTMFNVVRFISIDGSVRSPGNYTLKSNMTIKDLIMVSILIVIY